MASRQRPLSPHLQIYRWPLTMATSIVHRMTGVLLALGGSALLVYWLLSLAQGPQAYAHAHELLGSVPGQAVLFLWTLMLFYHLLNGIRHMIWDVGVGFELTTAKVTGLIVVAGAVVLTILTWLPVWGAGGGS